MFEIWKNDLILLKFLLNFQWQWLFKIQYLLHPRFENYENIPIKSCSLNSFQQYEKCCHSSKIYNVEVTKMMVGFEWTDPLWPTFKHFLENMVGCHGLMLSLDMVVSCEDFNSNYFKGHGDFNYIYKIFAKYLTRKIFIG
jgi:hypothetical protein